MAFWTFLKCPFLEIGLPFEHYYVGGDPSSEQEKFIFFRDNFKHVAKFCVLYTFRVKIEYQVSI